MIRTCNSKLEKTAKPLKDFVSELVCFTQMQHPESWWEGFPVFLKGCWSADLPCSNCQPTRLYEPTHPPPPTYFPQLHRAADWRLASSWLIPRISSRKSAKCASRAHISAWVRCFWRMTLYVISTLRSYEFVNENIVVDYPQRISSVLNRRQVRLRNILLTRNTNDIKSEKRASKRSFTGLAKWNTS